MQVVFLKGPSTGQIGSGCNNIHRRHSPHGTSRLRQCHRGGTILSGARASGPRVINWTGLSRKDQAAILPTLLSTNNWILLALAGKTEPETAPLLIQGLTKTMTTKGKAFRKMNWWQSGDDELAEKDRRVPRRKGTLGRASVDTRGQREVSAK